VPEIDHPRGIVPGMAGHHSRTYTFYPPASLWARSDVSMVFCSRPLYLRIIDNLVLSEPTEVRHGVQNARGTKRRRRPDVTRRLIHFWFPGFALPRSPRSPPPLSLPPRATCYVRATSPGWDFKISARASPWCGAVWYPCLLSSGEW
jgi:hypothetical protein